MTFDMLGARVPLSGLRRAAILLTVALVLAVVTSASLALTGAHKAFADQVTECVDQGIPPGWYPIRVNAGACGTIGDSITYTSLYTDELGTVVDEACINMTTLPAGWAVTNQRPDNATCSPTGEFPVGNNAATLTKMAYGVPVINPGGIGLANCTRCYNIFPGSIVSIYGGDLACSAGTTPTSSVMITAITSSGRWTLPQNDPVYWQQLNQINVTLPTNMPQNADYIVHVSNCNYPTNAINYDLFVF